MFHHFAPTGLPQNLPVKPTKGHHEQIERNINGAVDGIFSTNGSFDSQLDDQNTRPITYNLAHPDTVTLLRSLDAFFAHGLLKADKCYWAFAREFLPSAERSELRIRWTCQSRRALSLAWLKDSLNRANLHFQLLSFISCSEALKRAHYERNACMCNTALLKRVCLRVDRLAELHFNIEPPYVFQPEDTPIALPSSAGTALFFDGTMSPIGSSTSSLVNGVGPTSAQQQQRALNPNGPLNIRRWTAEQNSTLAKSLVGSFYEATTPRSSTFLEGLLDDLPEVDLSAVAPSAAEHVVRSDKEQSYILDQMLHNKRRSFTNFETLADKEEEENEERNEDKYDDLKKDKEQMQSLVRSYVPEDPEAATTAAIERSVLMPPTDEVCEPATETRTAVQQRIQHNESETQAQRRQNNAVMALQQQQQIVAVPSTSSLNSSSTAEFKFGSSSTTKDDDELSELSSNDTASALIEGEVLLEGHEKISLGLQVCANDVETVQHMFQVFVGHASGHPMVRYLLLTNKFLYLLAIDQKAGACDTFDVVDEREFGTISPASAVVEEWAAEAFEQNQHQIQQQKQQRQPQLTTLPVDAKKFERLHLLPLCDLDHLTMGIDAQVLCFHSRRLKFRCSPQSGHEQRLLAVETGSRRLGKMIAHCVRRAVEQHHRAWVEQRKRQRRGSVASPAINEQMTGDADELENSTTMTPPQQLLVSTSHSSHLALLLKRFLRRELGTQHLEIVHHSLVYWHQSDAPREYQQRRREEQRRQQQQQQQMQKKQTNAQEDGDNNNNTGESMECYMYVRELYQRSWGWRTVDSSEWQQSYIVLSGSKLYQFLDSTYKFAQRCVNIKDVVEQVYQAELVNDEKYVFQLDFTDSAQLGSGDGGGGSNGDAAVDENGGGGGPLLIGLQFSCPSVATMQKWIGALSLALSQSAEQPLPTACIAVLTETHVVFAQEGVNCLVDGFMRALSAFHVHEIAELCAIRTEFNSALVLRRDNGMDEWMLFREDAELDRLVERLRQQWNFPVQEWSADCETNLLNPSFNQLFLNCVRLPDLWHCPAAELASTMPAS